MEPAIRTVRADRAVRDLLAACGLDGSDLLDAQSTTLYGLFTPAGLAGVVGLEAAGESSLLRSLAIAPDARGQGYARELVAHAERAAAAGGSRELFLLTETAAAFFEHLDYQRIERARPPEAVRATTQFRMLCPADAVCLHKVLTPAPGDDPARRLARTR
jgi:amino-acid N-acetyltransferase